MTKPIKTIRRETGLIEGICEHNIGHPLYASADWMARSDPEADLATERDAWLVHGCCGCCAAAEWQISTLMPSVEMANGIILDHKEVIASLREWTGR